MHKKEIMEHCGWLAVYHQRTNRKYFLGMIVKSLLKQSVLWSNLSILQVNGF